MPRPGTVRIALVALMQLSAVHAIPAAIKECPYEAVVETDEAFARCGPGRSYYPTIKLKRGDRVTVRRHDPGGWFMIDPPPGSFSLIRADDVEWNGNVGTLKRVEQGQVSVRVGSAIDPTIDSIFQRKLSSGERVEILGEATIHHKDRQVMMLKIRPPKGEFRWIEGEHLTPADTPMQDRNVRERIRSDPFTAPPQEARRNRDPSSQQKVAGIPARPPASPPGGSPQAAMTVIPTANPDRRAPIGAVATSADSASRLEQIDLQFRDMVHRQPAAWDLAEIERAYRELQQSSSPAQLSQLELRFSSLDHYKQVKAEYDDYFRLVSNTARKDAELAAIQNSLAPQNTRPPVLALQPSGPVLTAPNESPAGATNGVPAPYPTPSAPSPPDLPGNASQPANGPPQNTNSFVGPVLGPPVPTEAPTPRAGDDRFPAASPAVTAPMPSPPSGANNWPASPSNRNQPRPEVRTYKESTTGQGGAPWPSVPANPRATVTQEMRQPPPAVGPATPRGSYMQPTPAAPASPVPLAAPRQIYPQRPHGFDGAGIIQRAATQAPGGRRHVLLAPNGRILAYLHADQGISLDAYLGRSMGIIGLRSFHPELQGDLIIVRGLVPVRLVP